MRFAVEETAGGSESGKVLELEYRVDGGSWADVTSIADVYPDLSPAFDDDDRDDVERIYTGAGTFRGGVLSEDRFIGEGGNLNFTGIDCWEVEWCLSLRSGSFSGGEVVEIRVKGLDTYSNTPGIIANVSGTTSSTTTSSSTTTTSSTVSTSSSSTTTTTFEPTLAYIFERDEVTQVYERELTTVYELEITLRGGVYKMGNIPTVEKQPFETFWLGAGFYNVLETDETIDLSSSNTAVTAVDADDEDASSAILQGSPVLGDSENGGTDNVLKIRVKEGTDGVKYKVTFRVQTMSGNKWEKDIYLKVKEL